MNFNIITVSLTSFCCSSWKSNHTCLQGGFLLVQNENSILLYVWLIVTTLYAILAREVPYVQCSQFNVELFLTDESFSWEVKMKHCLTSGCGPAICCLSRAKFQSGWICISGCFKPWRTVSESLWRNRAQYDIFPHRV